MKKKLTALALVVVMVAMLFTGLTMAYFTDTDEAVNVFTVGNIDIELKEEVGVTNEDGTKEYPDKVISSDDGAIYDNILPGNVLEKKATVTNTGNNPAYVRVTVILNNYDLIDAIGTYYENQGKTEDEIQTIIDEVFNGWYINFDHYPNGTTKDMRMAIPEADLARIDDDLLKVDSTFTTTQGSFIFSVDNWFKTAHEEEYAAAGKYSAGNGVGYAGGYYAQILNNYELCYSYYLDMEPGDDATLFQGLKCPTYFDQELAAMFENLQIEIYADAIQKEGFGDHIAGFEALEAAHPLSGIRGRVTNPPVAAAATADELKAALATAQPGDAVALSADLGTVAIDGTLEDVTIYGNGNGANFVITSTADLKNVTISGLETEGTARAVDIAAGAAVENLVITNSTLRDNSATPYGAIYSNNPNAEVTITDCTFVDCKYAVYGSTPMGKLTVNNNSFENVSSWAVLLNGADSVGAQLTITGNTFENCTGGIAKYLGSALAEGGSVVFTDNTLTNCKGHDGSDAKWFTLPASAEQLTVSGNTLDGAAWTPAAAQGLGK